MRETERSLRLFLEEAARAGGALAMAHFGRTKAEPKGESIVSEADRAVERLIVSMIRSRYPGDYVLAEESGASASTCPGEGTRWWAVDPIDGTGPYLSGLPFWSVSVACLRGGRMEGGAVFLPVFSEMYSAEAEGPAYRNGDPLPPLAPVPPGRHSFLFVPCRPMEELEIDFGGKHLSLASATLHLLYVATGRACGAVIEPPCAYDIAAASLVLERVGGRVGYASGAEVDYAHLSDGRRAPEPVVGASAAHLKSLSGAVSWKGR